MIKIESENKETIQSVEQIQTQYQADKDNVEKFLNHESPTFNFSSLRRLTLSELSYKGAFKYNKICGFTRRQILNMVEYPERYGNQIVRLSQFMYLKSGYYKRLIDYFVNMAVINWTVDMSTKQSNAYTTSPKTIRQNYFKYVAQVNKFKIDNRITSIMRKLFLEDACFGFVTENEVDASIFWIDPRYCEIKKLVNGNVFQYAVNRSLLTDDYFETLPPELQDLLTKSRETSLNNMVMIPYENSFCLKYNDDFTYLYPCFTGLVKDILEIDDYKDISKAKTESDAYKLIYMKIPTNDEGQMTMGDEIVVPFVSMCKDIVPTTFGVVPSPMDLQLIESKSTTNDNINKTQEAVENYYTEAGISKALISSASSGSELKSSIKVDSSDIYRIYRQIEAWVDLQMKLRGFIYSSYQFEYSILPTTIFDVGDFIDKELKLAQVSVPNKGRLLAANGINTAKLLGNSLLENNILGDIFSTWCPLSTSFTQSGSDDVTDQGGRPEMNEDDLSDAGRQTRENDDNNKANRDI